MEFPFHEYEIRIGRINYQGCDSLRIYRYSYPNQFNRNVMFRDENGNIVERPIDIIYSKQLPLSEGDIDVISELLKSLHENPDIYWVAATFYDRIKDKLENIGINFK